MRPQGSAQELERRRGRAVQAVKEGSSVAEAARALGVTDRSARRWVAAERDDGGPGLAAGPHPGPKPRLDKNRARQVLSWLKKSPSEFGFATELRTAPRVAHLIEERSGVEFRPRYVNEWPTRRGITPQEPERQPRERDARKIAAWRSRTRPSPKRKPPKPAPTPS